MNRSLLASNMSEHHWAPFILPINKYYNLTETCNENLISITRILVSRWITKQKAIQLEKSHSSQLIRKKKLSPVISSWSYDESMIHVKYVPSYNGLLIYVRKNIYKKLSVILLP